MNQNISKLHLLWIIPISLIALYIKFFTINSQLLPLENAFISQAINYNPNNIIDKYTVNITPAIVNIYNYSEFTYYFKLVPLIFSILLFYFLYKFTLELFNSQMTALLSVFLALLQAPLIFISQIASNDIIALTIFTLFLWHFTNTYKKHSFENLYWIYIISSEYILSVFLNYTLILLIPVISFILYKFSKKSAIVFITISFLLILAYFLIFVDQLSIQFQQILDVYKITDIKYYKVVTRFAEMVILPFMLFYAAYQFQWKSPFKKEFYFTILVASLILTLFYILLMDVYNFYRLAIYPLVILLPLNAYILKQFLQMNIHYKYSVVIISVFMLLFSFWTLSKFKSSYPKMDNLISFMKNYNIKENKIYTEDKFFIDVNFKPLKKINNIDKYYLSKQDKEIINKFLSGYYDVIVLNGFIHNKLTEKIREKYLRNYKKVYSEEFKTNSMLIPKGEGTLDVYVLKDITRINLNLLTIK